MTAIVELKGGLGNQLFHLAFANWLSQRGTDRVLLDVEWFRRENSRDTARELEVDVNGLGLPILGYHWSHHALRALSRRSVDLPYGDIIAVKKHMIWPLRRHSGYYQDYRFVQDSRSFLQPLLRSHLGTALQRDNSVTLHCRLGDYVRSRRACQFHGVTDPRWSFGVARQLKEKFRLESIELFSDDPDFIRSRYSNEISDFNVHEVTGPWPALRKMLSGRAFVLSNSTFSWWAVTASSWFLGPPDEVIFPTPWFAAPSVADSQLFNPEWSALDRDILEKVETEGI